MSGSTKSWLGKGWAPPGSKGRLSMGQCMATVGSWLDATGPGWAWTWLMLKLFLAKAQKSLFDNVLLMIGTIMWVMGVTT